MAQAIYWAKLKDLIPAIQLLPVSSQTFMMLERLPLTWLDEEAIRSGLRFEPFKTGEPFNQWERGRIFNEAGELRWEKMGEYFHCVYVGDDSISWPAPFKRETMLILNEIIRRGYFLWGKRLGSQALQVINRPPDANLFAEFRPGGILVEYPVSSRPEERVRIEVVEYIDPATQERLYYRFRGVEQV